VEEEREPVASLLEPFRGRRLAAAGVRPSG